MFDWFWNILFALGFFQKDASILILGLDNAGKTTMIHKLKTGNVVLFTPTQRAIMQEFTIGNIQFKAWDLGGHEQARKMWKDYFYETNAIIFVVDSADSSRFGESKRELHYLLNDEKLQDAVFLILANKSDLAGAYSRDQLITALDLEDIDWEESEPPVSLHKCSLVNGSGYKEAFQWLSATLAK